MALIPPSRKPLSWTRPELCPSPGDLVMLNREAHPTGGVFDEVRWPLEEPRGVGIVLGFHEDYPDTQPPGLDVYFPTEGMPCLVWGDEITVVGKCEPEGAQNFDKITLEQRYE